MALDEDLGTDVDGAMVLVAAAYAHSAGLLNLKGLGISTTYSDSCGAAQSLLAECGVTGVPIFQPSVSFVPTGSHAYQANMRTTGIARGYITGNEAYIGAVAGYRAMLVADFIDEFVITGYHMNFEQLLKSPADSISPLTGMDLVRQRVGRVTTMIGQYPSGSEYNANSFPEARAAAAYVATNCPVPITYVGYEIGATIVSGSSVRGLQNVNMLAKAMVDAGYAAGRESWDPFTVLAVAMNGWIDFTPVQYIYGSNTFNLSDGSNVFTPDPKGRDRYLVKTESDAAYASKLNAILAKHNWPYLVFG